MSKLKYNTSMEDIQITAEFCCNHMGDLNVAKNMIDALATADEKARVNIIKFQKRTPKELLTPEKYNAPHSNPKNSYGNTYGEHREFLEFSREQHKELKEYCEQNGFIYSSSVFDKTALLEILSLNPKIIKIGSANNTDLRLLDYLVKNYDGEIHISLGCITREEEQKIIKVINEKIENVVLYACTSAYPPKKGELCLMEVRRLKEKYGNVVKGIGFSGHHKGFYPDIAALALGATYFERHFTLNKKFKGTDHKISLTTEEISKLVKILKNINSELRYRPDGILNCEKYVRKNLKQITELEI